jgi:class 3 adenylate cyclase
MPEYRNIERSPNYEDLAPFTMLATFMNRRNSMTNVETEMKMRYSLQSTNDHKDHKSNVQRLKERFPTSRGNVLASRSSHGRASQRSSVIGSVVEAGTKSDEDISQEVTSGTPGRDSTPVPFTLIHQANERKRKFDLEREHLIESLVNFSCHTPIVLLEDLITHELQLYEGQKEIDRIIEDAKNKEIETTDDESLSSLSSDERGPDEVEMHKSNASIENNLQMPPVPHVRVSSLPTTQERESALLFVDISGFTNLSTMLDVETLSKVINSYFDMIVSEVILHGGDILKFAGDAFFAEWRTVNEEKIPRGREGENALKRLNASILSSSQDISWASLESGGTVSTCVWQAAICAASIVKKFSDFKVTSPLETFKNEHEAMLNVHCGIGAGHMIGLHVGDYREDDDERQEDEAVELRREYLFLGDAIDQVSYYLAEASGCMLLSGLIFVSAYPGFPGRAYRLRWRSYGFPSGNEGVSCLL